VAFAFALSGTRSEPAFWAGREGGWFALLSLLVVLLVGLAMANHRPEPPGAARICIQVLGLAARAAAGIAILQTARV
jgi:hypothetical protein